MFSINTHEFDKKGRCVRHPQVRLRKKKFFGNWKVLVAHCPDCVMSAMQTDGILNSLKDDNDDDSDDDASLGKLHRAIVVGTNHVERRPPNASKPPDDAEDSLATLSTLSTHTASLSSGCTPTPRRRRVSPPGANSRVRPVDVLLSSPDDQLVVCAMPHVDPKSHLRGSYTGQLNAITRLPDGIGTMRYRNGAISEGMWRNGKLFAEDTSLADSFFTSSTDQRRQTNRIVRVPSSRPSSRKEPPPSFHASHCSLGSVGDASARTCLISNPARHPGGWGSRRNTHSANGNANFVGDDSDDSSVGSSVNSLEEPSIFGEPKERCDKFNLGGRREKIRPGSRTRGCRSLSRSRVQ